MRWLIPLSLVGAAACGPSHTVQVRSEARTSKLNKAAAPASVCKLASLRLSAPGAGAVRPSVAFAGGVYAVVWEETAEHRSVHLQALDENARPLGGSVEVADL